MTGAAQPMAPYSGMRPMSPVASRRPTAMKFHALIESAGKTAAGIHVPDTVVEALGSGKRPAVRVTIGEHTYRSTVASMGGRFMLPVSVENRAKAGVSAGDEVDVTVELDSEKRVVEVPADFAAALARDAAAKKKFESLNYSEQRWFVMGVEGAKKAETRERRIAASVERLHSGRGQR